MPYQIGSARVNGTETVILATGSQYIAAQESVAGLPNSLLRIMEEWDRWHPLLAKAGEDQAAFSGQSRLASDKVEWLAPLRYPKNFICLGINYQDHVEEMRKAMKTEPKLPLHPYCFLKPAVNTMVPSGQTVHLPQQSKMVDWEGELGVILGRRVRNLSQGEALSAVAAYTIINDLSARDWIGEPSFVGIDWVIQKAYDGFAPLCPLLTPAAFVPNPQALPIQLKVNNQIKQDSNTANMIHSVAEIISYLSHIMTLEPGDVISTGTPAGAAYGAPNPRYLQSGDVVEVTIAGLGKLTTPIA